ncbi:hypothetical protein AGOR_G00196990 [Albula goreensis]|uniref:Uncharacterized protein n=1 Tax=Albula goreensis TaxID=1534307 RepID=A0A8T3CTF4_9TELE|nr:hypothetical protein AGOR_G00196990 [Albula goreensis]
MELRSSVKREDVEDEMGSRSGCEMGREEKDILSNIKEEEEEDGQEGQSKDIKVEYEVKDEELKELWMKQGKESEEHLEENEPDQTAHISGGMENGEKSLSGQNGESSCPVFACSQSPFIHMVEVKLHQHVEKASGAKLCDRSYISCDATIALSTMQNFALSSNSVAKANDCKY